MSESFDVLVVGAAPRKKFVALRPQAPTATERNHQGLNNHLIIQLRRFADVILSFGPYGISEEISSTKTSTARSGLAAKRAVSY